MYLFVGLGNIGEEYKNTRHNFGFLCVDNIIKEYSFSDKKTKFNAEIFFVKIDSKDVIIAKPTTYMNNSGSSVLQIKSFYKIPPENIFVFHDDLDLEFCRVKFKISGGSGGHNGIKSIDNSIGKNYARIRLGIGRPKEKIEVVNFVLSKFSKEELTDIERINLKISANIPRLFSEKKDSFINALYNNI